MSVRIGNKIVAGMPEKALHGIGEIFTTTDAGVIAGAVECNGGSYNLADYNSGTDSIASKLAAGSIAYVSKTEFQTQVANTGACGSFGWDGASDPTFLVPKLNPWHVGKNAPVVGNGTSPEFVNLNDNTKIGNHLGAYSNQYSGNNVLFLHGTNNNTENAGLTTDPTKSGMIADLSEITNLRVMVQLATGATDQALETCTSVLSDVSALNAHRVIEFQAPTAENGYTWYRKYADGWVEQGGVSGGLNTVVTLPVEMADTNYTLVCSGVYALRTNKGSATYSSVSGDRTSTTTITLGEAVGFATMGWQVSGKSAQ